MKFLGRIVVGLIALVAVLWFTVVGLQLVYHRNPSDTVVGLGLVSIALLIVVAMLQRELRKLRR